MTVDAIGVGAGGRDPAGPRQRAAAAGRAELDPAAHRPRPDAPLRCCSRPTSTTSTRGCGPTVIAALLAAGASDAWLTPILMKKGRPAHTLSVLVAADRADAVRAAIFRQTSTIGLREQPRRQARPGPRDA